MVCRPHIGTMTLLALAILLLAPPQSAAFDAGDVYWVPGWCVEPCGVFEVTAGDQLGASPTGWISRSPGQIVWADGAAYVTQFGADSIVKVTSGGAVSDFATGVSRPTGLLLTQSGTLLVASWTDTVYHATGGGDLSGAAVFADGFSGARNLLQLATGEILLADQIRRAVYDITAGGNFSTATPFATGLPTGPYDLVQDASGRIFGSTDGGVIEVTGGGDFSNATPHAYGRDFSGLAVDGQGRLLASVFDSGDIYDITTPGDYSATAAFATNLPGQGDTALDSVTGASGPPPQVVPAVGALGQVILTALLALTAAAASRR